MPKQCNYYANDAKAEKAVMHECDLNHIGTKGHNRNHVEIYVLSMFPRFLSRTIGTSCGFKNFNWRDY
jgi:hypothetical protein